MPLMDVIDPSDFPIIEKQSQCLMECADTVAAFLRQRIEIENRHSKELCALTSTFVPKMRELESMECPSLMKAIKLLIKSTDNAGRERQKMCQSLRVVVNDLEEGLSTHKALAKKIMSTRRSWDYDSDIVCSESIEKAHKGIVDEWNLIRSCKGATEEKRAANLEAGMNFADNAHNHYILTVASANVQQSQHFEKDVPEIMNCLETSILRWVLTTVPQALISMQSIIRLYGIQSTVSEEVVLEQVSDIDVTGDVEHFLSFATLIYEPPLHEYCTCNFCIHYSGQLKLTESSHIWLEQTMADIRIRLSDVISSIEFTTNDLALTLYMVENSSVSEKNKATLENKALGIRTNLRNLEMKRARLKEQLRLLEDADICDVTEGWQHDFRTRSWSIKTSTCSVCKKLIISGTLMRCVGCHENVHAKCQNLKAKNCLRQFYRRSSDPVRSSTTSESRGALPNPKTWRSVSSTSVSRPLPTTESKQDTQDIIYEDLI